MVEQEETSKGTEGLNASSLNLSPTPAFDVYPAYALMWRFSAKPFLKSSLKCKIFNFRIP
ncbi:hypothetical protein CP083_02350 [Candidatus Bathyarchaeota archaeon B24-2]|nr:MAG: hypothetical protein CP083_02350 [Candidatus Bathyarchaeota archaeon B24-2]